MLKKAFKHWQRYWWIYMLAMTLLVGGIMAAVCAIYPPIIPLIVAGVVIKGTAVLGFLTTLSTAASIAATAGLAAGATFAGFLGLRAFTAVLETFALSIKNCFTSTPTTGKGYDRLPSKGNAEPTRREQYEQQQRDKVSAAWSDYQQLLDDVRVFNQQYPGYEVGLTIYEKVSPPSRLNKLSFKGCQDAYDNIQHNYNSLRRKFTDARAKVSRSDDRRERVKRLPTDSLLLGARRRQEQDDGDRFDSSFAASSSLRH